MNKRSLWIGIIGLAVVATLVYFAIVFVAAWLKSLDTGVAAAVVTGAVGLIGLWYAQWATRSREIAESHRASKIEVYNIFFDIVDQFTDDTSKGKLTKPDEIPLALKSQFRKLNRGMIIWGSPAVIKAWMDFRHSAGTATGKQTLVKVDAMYQAIRADLGNSNWGLQSGDLIKSTLSDPENW